MARISGVDLPPNKRIEIGLTYIYGIGRSQSNNILQAAGVSLDTKVRELNDDEVNKIRKVIEEQYRVQGDLHQHQASDVNRLIPRIASSPWIAGTRPKDTHECAHAQGSATWRDRCPQEGVGEDIKLE